MRDLRTCCECGCVLTGVLCLSCDHILCAHCPPFVVATVEELQKQLATANATNDEFERNFSKRESSWIRENARLQNDLAAANKRIEELSAPVSDEEFKKFGIDAYVNRAALRYRIFHACAVNNLIAVRKRK